jgi:hypothetical protein
MRTRTVAMLLSVAVAIGMGVDLTASSNGWYEPALVRTDHTTPACGEPSGIGASPRPGCKRSACAQLRKADPVAQRRMQRHCKRRPQQRPPGPDASRASLVVGPPGRATGR